jgi:hypothetical protein
MSEVNRHDSDSGISHPKQPVSPEWKKDCKRNASGVMAASFTAGFAWIVASHTFIVLNNGRLIHPSTLGWPLYICIVIFAIGTYMYLSSEYEQLPLPWRKYAPVDHSAKDSLWFEKIEIKGSAPYGGDSDRFAMAAGPRLGNAGSSTLLVKIEKLSVSVGEKSATSDPDITFPLPPGRSQGVQSVPVDQIPSGAGNGEICYSVTYGPVSGYPVYRLTHKLSFNFSKPITAKLISRGDLTKVAVNALDIERSTEIVLPLPSA